MKVENPRVGSKPVTKALSDDTLPTSTSDDSKTYDGDIFPRTTMAKSETLVIVQQKSTSTGTSIETSMKIPKNFEEIQEWQKGMLDSVAEKYFDKEFLEGGAVVSDVSDMEWPSRLNSPSEK